jgi:hypothetical protein
MERLIQRYLRILDIDPFGYFIRLINISYNESVDLSNIVIRQFSTHNQTTNPIKQKLISNSYTFKDQTRPLLRSGEIVTIYTKDYNQLKFNIEPYIFIAQDILRWLTDDYIRTEISINKIRFNSYKYSSFSSNDIPSLFINRPTDSKQLSTKSISYANRYARFIFPYCLSNDNIVNPHTRALSDRNESPFEKNTCYQNNPIVKHFDSYSRRLTTQPQRIQSFKITSHV